MSEQSEWLTFFEEEKQKALAYKNEIDKTDKEIVNLVYALYGNWWRNKNCRSEIKIWVNLFITLTNKNSISILCTLACLK